MWAKQSTAATLIVGPILDSTGAEYTSAVIGDLSISKNGGTLTALASAAELTHIANGQYTLVLTTGNLDTLGRAQITCNKSTYQMPPIGLVVVPAMVFDSMVLGTDVLQSDVTQFGGTAGTFAAGIPTVELDSATLTLINDIPTNAELAAALAAITSQAVNTVTRSVDDTNPLTFNWPVSGATITATRSINNAAYGAVAGAIAFLRTEGTKHYYTLAHNAADRPTAEGTVRYKFDDGTYTRYVVMAVAGTGGGLTGPFTRTITVTDSDTSEPIEGASVRLYRTGETGTETTDVDGVATFTVEAAAWSYAITASGYTGVSGTIVVSANGNTDVELTISSPGAPDDPALCLVTMVIRDQYGDGLLGEPVEITFVEWAAGATYTPPVLSVPPVQETAAGGIVNVELYRQAVYRIVYGSAPYTRSVKTEIPDAGTFEIEI